PLHVEEFLGVASLARDLQDAGRDPEFSPEALVARARAQEHNPLPSFWPRAVAAVREAPSGRWQLAAITLAAVAVASLGLLTLWNPRSGVRRVVPAEAAALHLETRHGELRTYRLADNSVLHLNTDTS